MILHLRRMNQSEDSSLTFKDVLLSEKLYSGLVSPVFFSDAPKFPNSLCWKLHFSFNTHWETGIK